MDHPERKHFFTFFILFSCFVVFLAGCGGGGSSSGSGELFNGGGGTGEAMLSWSPPATNTDGSPADLTGFRVYAGLAANDLQPALLVSAVDTSAVIGGLAAGTYYFAVTAIGIDGGESAFSNIGGKTIL